MSLKKTSYFCYFFKVNCIWCGLCWTTGLQIIGLNNENFVKMDQGRYKELQGILCGRNDNLDIFLLNKSMFSVHEKVRCKRNFFTLS